MKSPAGRGTRAEERATPKIMMTMLKVIQVAMLKRMLVEVFLNTVEYSMPRLSQMSRYTVVRRVSATIFSASSRVGAKPSIGMVMPHMMAMVLKTRVVRAAAPARNLPLMTESL